jgi:hypothetical protein
MNARAGCRLGLSTACPRGFVRGVGVEPDRVGDGWGSWHTVGVLRDHTARYELWVTSVPPFFVSSVCWVGWGLVGVVFGC